ncbi:MAG: hypothetical protein NVS9B10_16280 [Nevskia sp.]
MNTTAWLGRVARRPRSVLLVVMLATALALLLCIDIRTGTPRFRINPSAEALLPEHDPGRAVLAQVRRIFGEDDPVIVAVRFAPSVYTVDNLARIDQLTKRLRALPGVEGVFSLATAPNLVASEDEIAVTSFTDQARESPETVRAFPTQLAANPLYRGTLVSADGTVAAFAITTGAMTPRDYVEQRIATQIRAAAAELAGDAPVWITGTLPVRAATTEALTRTLRFLVPGVFIVIATLLMLTFRSLRAMFAALVTVALALIWTLAAAVVLRIDFNLVSAIVPPLVITIGLSYTIHLLSAHFLSRTLIPDASDAQRREWVMLRISTGLTVSAMTTVIGFLSLLLNPLPAVRQFALLASIGTLFTGALTHLFLPAFLVALGVRREASPFGQRLFARFADRLAGFDLRYRRQIIAGAAVIIVVGAWFATQIRPGAEYIRSFDAKTAVRRDFEAINTAFNGANLVTIFVDTHVNDALIDPQQILPLEALEGWLREQPEVGAVVSYIDHLKLLNQAFHDNNTDYFTVPDSQAAIKQMLVFGGGDALTHVIDPRYRSTQISIRLNVDGSLAIGDFLKRLDLRLANLPEPLAAQVTGRRVLATS